MIKERKTKNFEYLWDGYGVRIYDRKTKQQVYVGGNDYVRFNRFLSDVKNKKMTEAELKHHMEREVRRVGYAPKTSFIKTYLREHGSDRG